MYSDPAEAGYSLCTLEITDLSKMEVERNSEPQLVLHKFENLATLHEFTITVFSIYLA